MMREPVSITVAPTGARRRKADHPAIPLTVEEIAAEAAACRRAGASILHLHVRDGEGRHSLDPGRYREAAAAVADACDVVVQPSTERAGQFGPDDMMAMHRALRSEMISLNLQELLDPDDEAQTSRVRDFLGEVAADGTVPQYIVYNAEQLQALARWWEAGWLPQANPFALMVLGRYAGSRSHPADVGAFLRHMPRSWIWGVCAFGPQELACVVQAALGGGHCRVGFENNVSRADGSPLRDNAEQVGRLQRVLDELGYAAATPAEVRRRFGCAGAAAAGCDRDRAQTSR
ncbi:MAG: 3-keto-5-aminohexanoate cleavage protein [Rhodocyclaceae bacterium]|nr:3-keto-5-aminohexanoate cleavage protein [Rhodocyclaceae bacterium]